MLPARSPMDRALARLQQDIDQAFRRLEPAESEAAEHLAASYPCDVHETDEHIIVEAELPGFSKDQISVDINQGILVIDAHRRSEKEAAPEGETRRHLHERQYAHVRRALRLPAPVNEEQIDAHLEHGVLTLTMPKAAEAKIRHIEIH
ncbi:MAG: Hsp20/alpha crystallin family protein [Phycisphaeraceae bacterium]